MTGADTPRKKYAPLAMFIILAVAYFMVYLHRTTGGAVSDTLMDHFDVGASSVALLASAYLYAYTLMMVPSGLLTDRFGPRMCATVFVTLIAAGSILGAVSSETGDFGLMVAGKFLIGIGAAVVYIPALKIIAVWFGRDRFASMNGTLLLVGNVGAIAAATPMVLMIDAIGLTSTYVALSVVTVAIAALCWLIVRDRPDDAPAPSPTERIGTVEGLRTVFSSGRRFWPLAIWLFLMYGTLMLWQASQAGSFYTSVHGYTVTDAGLMVTMVGVGMAVACPLAGVLSDRVFRSRRKVLIIGSVLYTIAWAAICATTYTDSASDMLSQGAVNLLLGFSGGFSVVAFAQIKELFPVAMAGTSTAALNLFPFAGGAILITISGFMVPNGTLEEYGMLWTIALVMMVAATVISLFTVEKYLGSD